MFTVKVSCPCCTQEFTGTGETEHEAREMANEALETHLELEIC